MNPSSDPKQRFTGRLLWISYVPAEGEPGSEAMLREVEKFFHEHQMNGKITVEYDTKVYYGRSRVI